MSIFVFLRTKFQFEFLYTAVKYRHNQHGQYFDSHPTERGYFPVWSEARAGRKMGHINCLGEKLDDAKEAKLKEAGF